MVMVCAQASIWMALHYLHVRYGMPRFLPNEITERAYRHLAWYGGPIPTAGLTVAHMVNAVAQFDYAPIVTIYGPSDPGGDARASEILRFAMPYLESQLPVILVFPGHAVCAVGHVIGNTRFADVDFVQRIADWTSGLVVHDDASGPYRILLRDRARDNVPSELKAFVSKLRLEDVLAAIVPVPQRAHSTAAAIETHVVSLLKRPNLPRLFPQSSDPLFLEWKSASARNGDDRLTIRTYRMDTVEYIRGLRSPDFDGFSRHVQEYYSGCDWPRWIWVSELIPRDRMEGTKERRVIGEIISDPTTNRYDEPFLAIHVPGFLIDVQDRNQHRIVDIPEDTPYSFGSAASYSKRVRAL
jgi:hypothetical protein